MRRSGERTFFKSDRTINYNLSSLVTILISILMYKTIWSNSSWIFDDISFIQTLKYEQLRESGVKEKEIQLIKDTDKETFDNWKFSLILKFKYALPKPVQGVFAFNDWDSAMKVLDKYLKKEKGFRWNLKIPSL